MKKGRILKTIIIIVVLTGLSIWIKSRWNAWFVSLPETETSVAIQPDRITITPGENFNDERTISWRCDTMLQPSYVEYVANGYLLRIKAKGNIVESRGGKGAFYNVELRKLKPNTKYAYRVGSGSSVSKWHHFSTTINGKLNRFIFWGDIQDTLGGNSNKMFERVNAKYPNMDAWAFVGDLIEAPIDKFWNYTYSSLDSVPASIPILCAPGNHEYIKSLYRKLDSRWTHTFVYPENGAGLEEGNSYYIKDDRTLFVVLDSNGLQDAITVGSTYYWLNNVLKEESKGRWVILMFHHPIYSMKNKNNNMVVRNAINPLVQKYKVHLVLQGHEHGYSSMIDDKGTGRGYPVFIISHASPKSYKVADKIPGMKIIKDTRMYQIINIDDNTLNLKAYNADNDKLLDEITIKR